MDRIYRYNSDASYKPNGGTYLQQIGSKDLYIQNITVSEHDKHSESFQIKFPNIFTIIHQDKCELRIKNILIGTITSSHYGKHN